MRSGAGHALRVINKASGVTLVRTDDERQRLVECVRGGGVEGVPLMSVRAEDVLPDMLADAWLPTVLLGRRSGDDRVTYVDMDNGAARASRSATWPAVAGFEDFEPAEQTEPSLFTAAGSRPVGRPDVPCPGRTVRRLAGTPSGTRAVGPAVRKEAGPMRASRLATWAHRGDRRRRRIP